MPRKNQDTRIGRPTKYSSAVAEKICQSVAEGCSREAAAALAGVSPSTLHEWRNKFPEFSDGLEKADATSRQPAWHPFAKLAAANGTGLRTPGFWRGIPAPVRQGGQTLDSNERHVETIALGLRGGDQPGAGDHWSTKAPR